MPANPIVGGKELSLSGRIFRMARLRHEWCDFVAPGDIAGIISTLRGQADVFTFVSELGSVVEADPKWTVTNTALAVLRLSTFDAWWVHLGFKARNKVRKAEKYGIQFKVVKLDRAFAVGVQSIYNESPVKQGRKFVHYGKSAAMIEMELSSFPEQTTLVGAYLGDELVGFMKLFHGNQVLRTVHIISSIRHKEKCVMDGLIAKAVELGCHSGCSWLHYGSWTDGGVGTFREKHGFVRETTTRVFLPLTWRGRQMLRLNFHRPLREQLPVGIVSTLRSIRGKWSELFGGHRRAQAGV